ncbi:hypothetical protein TVAG_413140 [Trichomonas vaginalis G3]|uniref:Beige/BEACH domain containing protein n=1 Tax=Trichomonas vaginalis (strain ATCC PRA-98 / G3) TaxID=412133 RepID=A2FY67_TRIV3|nr:hypothetical protein TVAGG3_0193160 [Trichomonas vaginalis G3]EAX90145.1 hypothetical protein TVAG_413140 [Trichomonas vaginalis G3]KAI5550121.1 hypothetical protein TVAGG3_0193160 [Trichomonas vaginalis G3]|eukprot:XP_001303075.1 hypothetical protein [Trichomonas vaginalis G3]
MNEHEKQDEIIVHNDQILQQVKTDFKLFRSETDPIKKSQNFSLFLSSFNEFLANETDHETLIQYIQKYCNSIADYSTSIREELPIFIQTMHILEVIAEVCPMDEFIQLYISYSVTSFHFVDKFQISTKTISDLLHTIFNTEVLFNPFCVYNGIDILFYNSFVGNENKDLISTFSANNIPQMINQNLSHYINYEYFITKVTDIACSHIIQEKYIKDSCLFVARVIKYISMKNHDCIKFFVTHDGFVTFDLMLANSKIEDKIDIFTELLEIDNSDASKPPNLDTIFHIKLLFDNQPENQRNFFKLLIQTIDKFPNSAEEIDKKTKLTSWMSFFDLNLAIELIEKISVSSPLFVKNILPYLFRKLIGEEKDVTKFDKVLKIFSEQIKNGYLDISSLLDIGFLQIFIFSLEKEKLVKLLSNSDNLSDILISFFKSEESLSFRKQILKVFCEILEIDRNLTVIVHCLSSFISVSPDSESLQIIMDLVDKIPSLLFIFDNSFLKNTKICDRFCHFSLNWLCQMFLNQKITENEFLTTLSFLTSKVHYVKVDKMIEKLLEEDKLKLNDANVLKNAVFGRDLERNLVMIHPLCRFLKEIPINLHPYSKAVFGQYLDTEKLIKRHDIYNQFVSNEKFNKILDNFDQIENDLQINENFDNSPLIYLDFNSKISVTGTFSLISFWFKKVLISNGPFFEAKNVKLSFENDNLICGANDQKMTYKILPEKWNFVCIQIELYALKININRISTVFSLLKMDTNFAFCHFLTENSKVYISPIIKLSNHNINDVKTLISNGPFHKNQSKDFVHLNSWNYFDHKFVFNDSYKAKNFVTQNYFVTFHQNSFIIPYYSLCSHFLDFEKFKFVFDKIENFTNTQKTKILTKLILIFKINDSKQKQFIFYLSKFKDLFTNPQLSDYLIDSLSKVFKGKVLLENLLRESLLTKEIVISILNKIRKEDFTKLFEDFLCQMILETEEIVYPVLKRIFYFSRIPKFVICVLRSGHQINLEKIQMSILKNLTVLVSENENYCHVITKYLQFEHLQNLFIETESKQKCFEIFVLIMKIHLILKNFCKFSLQFCFSLTKLKDIPEVWTVLIDLQNKKLIPQIALLHMIWAVFLSSFYSISFLGGKENICEENARIVLSLMLKNISHIAESNDCYSFIVNCFPLIFHSKSLFGNKTIDEKVTVERNNFENFPELRDEFWQPFIKTVRNNDQKTNKEEFHQKDEEKHRIFIEENEENNESFTEEKKKAEEKENTTNDSLINLDGLQNDIQNSSNFDLMNNETTQENNEIFYYNEDKTEETKDVFEFLSEIVSNLILDSNLEVNFQNFNAINAISYVSDHPLITFLSSFAFNAKLPSCEVILSLLYNPLFYDSEIGNSINLILDKSLFTNAEKAGKVFVKQILMFYDYILHKSDYSINPYQILKEIIELAEKMKIKTSLANQFSQTLLSFISQSEAKSIDLLLSVLFTKEETLKKIIEFSTIKSKWLEILSKFDNQKSNILISFVKNFRLKDKNKEILNGYEIYENSRNSLIENFVNFITEKMKIILSSNSISLTKSKILSEILLSFLSTTKPDNIEYWTEEIKSKSIISEKRFLSQFSIYKKQPKFYLKNHFESDSDILEFFKRKITKPDKFCNCLERFFNEFSKSSVYFNVSFQRNSKETDSVIFFFHNAVILLIGSTLVDDRLVFNDYDFSFVMEEVFNHTLGITARFFSSVLLMIEQRQILSLIKFENSKSFSFWSLSSGHFTIKCHSEDDFQRSLKYIDDLSQFTTSEIFDIDRITNDFKNGKIDTEEFISFYNLLNEKSYSNSKIDFDAKKSQNLDYKYEIVEKLPENVPKITKFSEEKRNLSTTSLPYVYQVTKENFSFEEIRNFFKKDKFSAKIKDDSLVIEFCETKEVVRWHDSILKHWTNIFIDDDFCFVTFSFDEILVFRAVSKHQKPMIVRICQIQTENADLLCYDKDNLIIALANEISISLIFFPLCETIFKKKVEEKIISLHFLRSNLYVVYKHSIEVIDYEGSTLYQISFPNEITCSSLCGDPKSGGLIIGHKTREFSFGFENEFHQSKLSNDKEIVALDCDEAGSIAICQLKDSKSVVISSQCLGGNSDLISKSVDKCYICHKHSSEICPSCMRALCSKCFGRDSICPLCLEYSQIQSQK